MHSPKLLLVFALISPALLAAPQDDPKVEARQPGVKLVQVAKWPEVVTPTGIDVDERGRVWVVACHTHMPPEDYGGKEVDEVLVFHPDGRRESFFEGTETTMGLLLGPSGWVYLSERDRILRIRDGDGDGRADTEETLLELETEADYPHNGLAAMAWNGGGELVFGLGENRARGWTLTGPDGTSCEGTGEGGIFRCRPDGTGLHRIARGMWNPFGLCVRDDGEMFAAENDPGERPPCRLLHVVEGGDYGFQRLYGNAAHHPFVCWNGQLRGTLPMVGPVGEAPCGIVPLGNGVIVPSWSDHRIDFHRLHPEGASFESERIQLVSGGRYFRPVSIAADPRRPEDGTRAWYLTDWIDGRYPVHGYGRLWRLEIDPTKADWMGARELEPATERQGLAERLRGGENAELSADERFDLAAGDDPFLAHAALLSLAGAAESWTVANLRTMPTKQLPHAILALREAGSDPADFAPELLTNPNPMVGFETLRWIADARATEFLPEVKTILNREDLGFRVFEAAMAARNTLEGRPEAGVRHRETLLERVGDPRSSARIRAYALRLLPKPRRSSRGKDAPAAHRFPKGLSLDLLRRLLEANDTALSREVVFVLVGNPRPSRRLLMEIATDPERDATLRADAVVGLGLVGEAMLPTLVELASHEKAAIRNEALRALRGRELEAETRQALRETAAQHPGSSALVEAALDPASLAANRPPFTDTEAWNARIAAVPGPGNSAVGRRLFFNPRLASCSNCHRHRGRGAVVGPDLGSVGARRDRTWLLESILEPNAEMAPEFQPRMITLESGETFTGIRLRSSTSEVLRDATGRTRRFDRDDIAKMEELPISFMPPALVANLTLREIRDLIHYLQSSP